MKYDVVEFAATFKTPGVNVNIGTKGDVFVLTEEQRHILMDYKRSELLAWTPPPPEETPALPEPPATPRELGE